MNSTIVIRLVIGIMAVSFVSIASAQDDGFSSCQSRGQRLSALQQWNNPEASQECQQAYSQARKSPCFSDSQSAGGITMGDNVSLSGTEGLQAAAFNQQAGSFAQQMKACDKTAGTITYSCSKEEGQTALEALQSYTSCAQDRARKSMDLASDAASTQDDTSGHARGPSGITTASARTWVHCVYLACSLLGSISAGGTPSMGDVPMPIPIVTPVFGGGGRK